MKILMIDNQDNVIVRMKADEAAQLAGFRSHYSQKQASKMFKLDEIVPMTEMYKQASEVLTTFEEIQTAAKTLKGAATRIQNHAVKE